MSHLYLIPTFLAPGSKEHIAPETIRLLGQINCYIVERIRTARRFIRALDPAFPIDKLTFVELDKHDFDNSLEDIKELFNSRVPVGFMSEAGSPCIADPGARIVNIAREAGYKISPLSGPSSIMLGLMASGMNGQKFSFYGYLPIRKNELSDRLRKISQRALKNGDTHLFIETPYRNASLLAQIKKHVDQNLFLSIGIDLTGPNERIITKPVSKWDGNELSKEPCIFCIGKLVR